MNVNVWKGSLRRNASSTKQSRGQKDWSALKGDTSKGSTDKNKHQGNIGQKEAKKYLRESCYHRIECSVTNSLAALIRK